MYTKSSNRVADSTLSNTNSNEYNNKNIKIQKNIKLKKPNIKSITNIFLRLSQELLLKT